MSETIKPFRVTKEQATRSRDDDATNVAAMNNAATTDARLAADDGATHSAQAASHDAKVARGSSLRRITSIARNAFREAVRDRVLYNLVVFVLLLTIGAIFLGELSAAQEAKIIVDMGLSAMLIFGVFISIFVGVGLVSKEIERRTVYAIFAKPVGRGEFLVGKYLGLCATLAVNVCVMSAGIALALLYVRRGYDPLVAHILPAIALVFFELTIIVAVALLFSSFSTPALSALLTFAVFVIGHFSADLRQLAAANATAPARLLFGALYYLLPNLSHYAYITAASHGTTPNAPDFFAAILYAIIYDAALLTAATLIFNRRNFK